MALDNGTNNRVKIKYFKHFYHILDNWILTGFGWDYLEELDSNINQKIRLVDTHSFILSLK